MQIKKVDNGYIVTTGGAFSFKERIHSDIESVFKDALLHFEGRCENFGGDSYGKVRVELLPLPAADQQEEEGQCRE
jgi:hypothetical protein